jgi:hypothetical protein
MIVSMGMHDAGLEAKGPKKRERKKGKHYDFLKKIRTIGGNDSRGK